MRFENLPGGPSRNTDIWPWLQFLFRRRNGFTPGMRLAHVLSKEQTLQQFADANGKESLTWLGHNSFIIRIDGLTILVDPFLTERASPFTWLGPKRYVSPALEINELPDIDVVLITHDHYDHLDQRTLRQLKNKENIKVIAPLEVGKYIRPCGFQHINELKWHDHHKINNTIFTAVPAMHFSKRSFFRRNDTLWAGYSIATPNYKIYISGDTAYASIFKDIGEQYGPFDFALIDIGAYEPRDLMKEAHVNPEEAVEIAKDIKAKNIIAMHWGTIHLTDEPILEPPERFLKAGKAAGFSDKQLWLMNIGETRTLQSMGSRLDPTRPPDPSRSHV